MRRLNLVLRWGLFLCLLTACGHLSTCGAKEESSGDNKQEVKKELQWKQGLKFFFEQGRRPEAHQRLSSLYEDYPDFKEPYFHFILGEIEWRWHNYPVAIRHFLQELDNWNARYERPFPTRTDLLWYIADAHHQMGLLFKGFFNSALNVERNYYDFLLSLNVRRERGSSAGELTLLPYREDFIYYFRGLCHFYLGEGEKARRDWQELGASSELYSRARAMLGLIAFKDGRTREAEQIWEKLKEDGLKQGEPGVSELLTGAEPWRSRGLERLARTHQNPSSHARAGVYYAWGLAQESGRLDEVGEILDSVTFAEPELRHQWGKLVPIKGEPIEYYADFYDPFWLNILADYHLRVAARYYRQHARESQQTGIEAYGALIDLALGEIEAAQKGLESLSGSADQKLKLAALLGLRVIAVRRDQGQQVERLDQRIRQMVDKDSSYRSDYGRLLVEMGGEPQAAIEFCRSPEIWEPGMFSRNMAYVRFVQGMKQQNMEVLTRAIESYEKNHRMETQYSVRQNDPMVLQGLANAFYGRRWFNFGPKIYLKFRDMYPEVEQIFDCLRHTTQIWETLKWDKSDVSQIEWRELSRQRAIWYSSTLKEMLDSVLTP